jgi:hypothetical protein
MSELGKTAKPCNILDMINGDSSREHSENSIEYVESIDKDIILPSVDGGRQAWAFMLGAFMIEGLMWGKYYFPHLNGLTNIDRFPVSLWSLPIILSK